MFFFSFQVVTDVGITGMNRRDHTGDEMFSTVFNKVIQGKQSHRKQSPQHVSMFIHTKRVEAERRQKNSVQNPEQARTSAEITGK